MGAFAHFTGLAKSMIMASSRVLAMEWAWRIRMHKGNPIPNYAAMTDENWKQFDVELKKALVKDLEPQDMKVEVTNAEMFAQYGHLAHAVVETSAKVVPKKKKAVKTNGNRVSEKTLGLHKQRTRDFASGRKITIEDRKAWNRILAQAARDDYKQWLERWVKEIEKSDGLGDTKAIYDAVKVRQDRQKILRTHNQPRRQMAI